MSGGSVSACCSVSRAPRSLPAGVDDDDAIPLPPALAPVLRPTPPQPPLCPPSPSPPPRSSATAAGESDTAVGGRVRSMDRACGRALVGLRTGAVLGRIGRFSTVMVCGCKEARSQATRGVGVVMKGMVLIKVASRVVHVTARARVYGRLSQARADICVLVDQCAFYLYVHFTNVHFTCMLVIWVNIRGVFLRSCTFWLFSSLSAVLFLSLSILPSDMFLTRSLFSSIFSAHLEVTEDST